MNITFTGNTALELKNKMIEFCKTFNVDLGDERQLSLPGFTQQEPVQAETSEQPAPPPKKRGPKPKQSKTTNTAAATGAPQHDETTGETEEESVVAAPTSPQEVNRDMAMDALKKAHAKHGVTVARNLLGKYNSNRVSEVPEDKLFDFINDCNDEKLIATLG